jgi:hypothetical protein
MIHLKKYLKNLFRFLTAVSVIIAILVFTTGKMKLEEYIDIINGWFGSNSSPKTTHTTLSDSVQHFKPSSDNLLTTICKTFFLILAVIFLCFASIISALLEIVIWIVSLGHSKFYCTKQIWNLCWTEIASNWYWTPAKNTYLWITFLLYGGLFGTKSVNGKQANDGSSKPKRNVRRR